MPRIVRNWLPLFLPAALMVFYFPVLTGTRFFWEDAAEFYPEASLLANSLHHFRLPYWSPYTSGGVPLIATSPGAFYPPNWLLALFVGADGRLSFWAIELEIILHLLLAGWTMYLLAREWKLSSRAAVYAGLVFMLSGFMTVRAMQPGVVFALAWLPLVLLLVVRALEGRRFAYASAAGLTLGIAVLGGHPQIVTHMAYALGLYVVFYAAGNWRAEGPRALLRGLAVLGMVGLIGAGIGAVQYLPTWEFSKYSDRASATYDFITNCSLAPSRLLTLLVPKAIGYVSGPVVALADSSRYVPRSQNYTHYYWHYWETVIYVGVLPLFLAGFALVEKKQPRRWFLAVLAVLALVLALGRYTPLFRVAMAVVPGFGMFRIPARLGDLFTFAACALAGFGMEVLLREEAERPAGRALKTTAAIAGSMVLFAVLLAGSFMLGQRGSQNAPEQSGLARQWMLFAVLALGTALLFFWRTRKSWLPAVGFWLITAITFVDFCAFGRDFNASSLRPTQFPFAPSAAIAAIHQESGQEAFRVSMGDGSENRLGRNRGDWERIEMIEGYSGWYLARLAQVGRSQRILDLFNVRYVIDSTGRNLELNPGCLPRARMVYRYWVAASDSAALNTVRESGFDYRNVAVLEREPGVPNRQDGSITNAVAITSRETDRMELHVGTDSSGILVLSEVFYPEWKARVDGRPADIYPVDYVLRGVTIPAGSHRVEMYFDAARVYQGMLVSLLTLAFAAGFASLSLRRAYPPGKDGRRTGGQAR